ncbi:8-oxo-dGTP pyrophosphatase MutT, NUDIX family [Ekhidna lutea]|uniref:8-oxo-dGTP pyrophosphatase MutT, NUDIX family n=1 Tax=Ekhidna lutea TaxID=447679 RepID=A0A239HSC8_EKHLU|nr:NUDIX domain-containing protein [Ekhidna lutea]SNS84216.1 8-oxo-dGTP pyrophosphatase MutT, NUDIX family [Ekhidna lutea]
MIRFERGNNQFNFRSIALLIEDNSILIQRDLKDDFWALPGGRVELFENSNDTVVREIYEELGWKVQANRPVWFIENFFKIGRTNFHEIATIYLMDLVDYAKHEPAHEFKGLEDHLIFQWFDISKLDQINFRPRELRSKLGHLPNTVEFLTVGRE